MPNQDLGKTLGLLRFWKDAQHVFAEYSLTRFFYLNCANLGWYPLDELEAAFDDKGSTSRIVAEAHHDQIGRESVLAELCEWNFVHCLEVVSDRIRRVREWVGTLLFYGLQEHFILMIMGLERYGVAISGDSIKSELLHEICIAATTIFPKADKLK